MQMLYNSDNFAVVQIDVTAGDKAEATPGGPETLTRDGYEIVDKFARRGIFIEGAMAASFKAGVDALIETSPTEEALDDYISRYTALMQQPVILH